MTAFAGLAVPTQAADGVFRFGLTPVFLDSDVHLLKALTDYLSKRLDRPVELIKRRTYQDITLMLLSGQLDAAWICGFPYIQYQSRLAVIAVPLYQQKPLYQSYLIVSDGNEAEEMSALAGDVHAFSDPDSNSGFLVTRALLAEIKQNPSRFFRHHFFTYGHRNVIRAVASGLADSGSVDGYVHDVMAELEPELVGKTRVIRRSEWLGFPPIACLRQHRRDQGIISFTKALQDLSRDDDGRAILNILRLDGFVDAEPNLFDGIAAKLETVRSAA